MISLDGFIFSGGGVFKVDFTVLVHLSIINRVLNKKFNVALFYSYQLVFRREDDLLPGSVSCCSTAVDGFVSSPYPLHENGTFLA